MQIIETGNVPIKAWVDGVEFEDSARAQLLNIAQLPIVANHIAVLPDCHMGIGATVGSVIATRKAIIPAAVGVDIGCGVCSVKTSLKASDLPDDLSAIRHDLERTIPVGFNMHNHIPSSTETAYSTLDAKYKSIVSKNPKISAKNPANQLGTLGGGNHYIELVLDESQHVWLMLHSGSRGAGNRIGQYFIEQARKEMDKKGYGLPDKDLAWLDAETTVFNDYVEAFSWAQDYAKANRANMLERCLDTLHKRKDLPKFKLMDEAVNCHHNYVSLETHFNESLYVTRKGAVSAGKGELGLIPGSMGAKSFVVKGLGNPESYNSCSHGAGRRMGRNQAKKTFTLEDLCKQTEGVECRKDKEVIDEIPGAYKDVDAVMRAQSDLVEIVHTLKGVLCIKG